MHPQPFPATPLPDAPRPDAPQPDERLRPALEALAAADLDIAEAYGRCGLPPERGSEPGFPGLIRMIAGQQVSVPSARAIIARLEVRVRSEARRVGKECVRTCRFRWSRYH